MVPLPFLSHFISLCWPLLWFPSLCLFPLTVFMETRKKTQHEILYWCRLQINFNQIFSHFRDSASMLDVLTQHPLIFGKCVVAKTAFSVKVGLYNGSTEIQSSLVWIISSKQSVIIEASVTLPFFSNLTTITTKTTHKNLDSLWNYNAGYKCIHNVITEAVFLDCSLNLQWYLTQISGQSCNLTHPDGKQKKTFTQATPVQGPPVTLQISTQPKSQSRRGREEYWISCSFPEDTEGRRESQDVISQLLYLEWLQLPNCPNNHWLFFLLKWH